MLRETTDMDLLRVAQVVKSYDVNGEVVIRLSSGVLEDYNFKKEPVFIIFDGLPVPFFKIDPDSIELDEDEAMAEFLIGFKVKDQSGKQVGEISDYFNYPNNPCIELNGEHLVPFNEDLILKLDHKKRIISMTIPGGILDL